MDQVIATILWYLLLAGIGWLSFPIAYRYLGALPNRGIAFVRPLGLLLWGFLFWILSSYGFLRNDTAGLLTAALLLAALSWWAWRSTPKGEMRQWLRGNTATIIAVEIVFLLTFVFMTYVRASRPGIFHTEQPMELAFINAILRSPTMPPHDPWLSGFSISYYYFGYLMVAMMAKLMGVIGSVAFNLGFISIFAMAATAAYGLAHNLLVLYLPKARRAMYWFAVLAPLFVLILGNMEGLLEIIHAQHIFWGTEANGSQSSKFWAWMDIKELVNPPTADPGWAPRLYGTDSWWWWRASRVINDRAFSGGEQELIDEFPAFSFVLGDLHPHVLSMPFVMLAMGLALNAYLSGAEKRGPPLLGLRIRVDEILFAAVLLGALGFLNIWDFPIYVGLFALAYVVREAQIWGWTWKGLQDFLVLGFTLGLSGIAIFLPFYLGFTSQAGGILPNLLNPTRGAQFWVMFAGLLIPISIYLLTLWNRDWNWARLAKNIVIGFLLVAALWGFSLLLTGLLAVLLSGSGLGQAILSGMGAPDLSTLLNESLRRRFISVGGWVTLSLLLGLIIGLLFTAPGRKAPAKTSSPTKSTNKNLAVNASQTFLLILMFVGLLLVLAPEFVYLRDQFGTRMNTVFKFYFQAWQMWGVAAAVAAVILLYELRQAGRVVFAVLFALLIGAGLVYPVFAFSDVTRHTTLSLDGASHLSPDTVAAIQWLQQAPLGALVEAVGGSYDSNFARYSAHSGQPGLMGWPGHEGQWRGGDYDVARIDQIRILYTTNDWLLAQSIIDTYDVRYILVGEWEEFKYNVDDQQIDEEKFKDNLVTAFENEMVTIYEVP
jgi:YYY domain-containing protein